VVAFVGLGDQLIDLAGRHLGKDAIALADWQQDGIEHLVDALDDVGIATLEPGCLATLLELTLLAVLQQLGELGLEALQYEGDVVTFCFIFS